MVIGSFGKNRGLQWLSKRDTVSYSAPDADLYLPKVHEDNLFKTSTDANGDEVHMAVFTAKVIMQWIAWNA
jgi:hypothetical protein